VGGWEESKMNCYHRVARTDTTTRYWCHIYPERRERESVAGSKPLFEKIPIPLLSRIHAYIYRSFLLVFYLYCIIEERRRGSFSMAFYGVYGS
jgi:hypothetical protein